MGSEEASSGLCDRVFQPLILHVLVTVRAIKLPLFVHDHNLLWPSCKLHCGVIISKWDISDFCIVVSGSGMGMIFMFCVLFASSPKTVPPLL